MHCWYQAQKKPHPSPKPTQKKRMGALLLCLGCVKGEDVL